MRFLVPAASAAFIAVAVAATTAVPAARARSAPVSSAQASSVRLFMTTPTGTDPVAAAAATPTATASATEVATATATATATTAVTPRGDFTWPLSPRPAVLRRFEQPRNQWSPGHRGVDLLAAVGQPVLSAGDGIVAFSGVISGRGVITVRHSGGLRTTYEPVDERFLSGTVVHRGTRIGVLSSTPGHCVPGHCLHWGALSGQTYHDPLSLLGFGRPILLPLG